MSQKFSLPVVGLFFVCFAIFSVNSFIVGKHDKKVPWPIKVASFNIRHFGRNVVNNEEVLSAIVKIMDRYDVVLVLEARDATNTALHKLNDMLTKSGPSWKFEKSKILGRNKYYQEQYAFFYKTTSVYLINTYQVKDTKDHYERAPFAAEFISESFENKQMTRFVLFGFHSKPTATKQELLELPKSITYVKSRFPRADGLIALGDFNADCSYLSGKNRHSYKIFHGSKFKSLIGDDADTAVKEGKSTECAYDRAVVYGDKLDVRDAGVFDFEKAYGLTEKEALKISDHFPIEFSLY